MSALCPTVVPACNAAAALMPTTSGTTSGGTNTFAGSCTGHLATEAAYSYAPPGDGYLTLTLTAAADVVAARDPGSASVHLTEDLEEPWLAALRSYRPLEDEDAVRAVLTGSPAQVFATVTDGDEVVAAGRLGVASAWGGIAAMWVSPTHRRRGLARAVVGALAAEARRRGTRSLHLQVHPTNGAAMALYEAAGFAPHHAYAHLTSRRDGCR